MDKQQICVSETGFADFNLLMKSGSLSNVNMDGAFKIHLNALCRAAVPRLIEYGLGEQMADVKKVYDFNLQLNLCQKIMPACGKKKKKKQKEKKAKQHHQETKEKSWNEKREEAKKAGAGKTWAEKQQDKRKARMKGQQQEDDIVTELMDDVMNNGQNNNGQSEDDEDMDTIEL